MYHSLETTPFITHLILMTVSGFKKYILLRVWMPSLQANKVASIIESRLPGSTLKATSTEDEVIEQIIKTEGAERRDRGCFYNGAGKNYKLMV